jgi:hypothetical protein
VCGPNSTTQGRAGRLLRACEARVLPQANQTEVQASQTEAQASQNEAQAARLTATGTQQHHTGPGSQLCACEARALPRASQTEARASQTEAQASQTEAQAARLTATGTQQHHRFNEARYGISAQITAMSLLLYTSNRDNAAETPHTTPPHTISS